MRPGRGIRVSSLALGVALAGGPAGVLAQPSPGAPNLTNEAVPARPDTAVVAFEPPAAGPDPKLVGVAPDSVAFGGTVHLVWEWPADAPQTDRVVPTPEAPWLVPDEGARRPWWRFWGEGKGSGDVLDAFSAAEGPRVAARYRVYRTDPFVFFHDGTTTPPVTVIGRNIDAARIAGVRDPRPMGLGTWQMLVIITVLVAASVLAWWLWRHRKRRAPIPDWIPPLPVWPTAAVELADLLRTGALERGDARLFLDDLSRAVRRYAGGRYGIAAVEMTGDEIVAACHDLGYDAGHPVGFARLIDEIDRRRYDPAPPDPGWCREMALQFFGRLDRVRVLPFPGRVPAALQLEGEKAWAYLREDLGTGAGRLVAAGGPGAREVG